MHTKDSMPPPLSAGSKRANSPVLCPPNGSSKMRKVIFHALVQELWACGLHDSRYITLNEQIAIFLYTCVTWLSSHHVTECFQHSHTTIQRYVCDSLLKHCLAAPANELMCQ